MTGDHRLPGDVDVARVILFNEVSLIVAIAHLVNKSLQDRNLVDKFGA